MSKSEKKTSTAKVAFIYTTANIITRGMAFLTTPIFSRLMTKEEYGQFSNIASWVNILSVIATADLYTSIQRAKYDFNEEMDQFLSSIMVLSNLITLCLYVVVERNISFFETFFLMDKIYIRFIFIYLVFWPASQFLQKKSQIYNKYKSVVAISGISLISSTGASILLIMLLENKLLARMAGNYLVVMVFDAALWGYILYKGRCCLIKHCLYALRLAIPLIPHTLAGNLLTSSDRIIINQLCGTRDAALYSLAYMIAMIVTLILHSLNQAYVPWLYDRLYENDVQSINKNSVAYIGIFDIFATVIMLAAPEIVLIFGGKDYYEARFVIAPVVLGIALQFVHTLYVNIEFYTRKTYFISCGTVLAAVINISLNYCFIPRWGYIAAAYTTMIGYLFMLIFNYTVVRLTCRQYADAYNKKAIALSVFSLSVLTAGSIFLYEHIVLRYAVILIGMLGGGVLVYQKRTFVKQKLKR